MVARWDTTPRTQQDRLVAVLQQGPDAPAFLLTFDMQHRTLIIRRVSATAETGKSYELWLISKNFSAPRARLELLVPTNSRAAILPATTTPTRCERRTMRSR